MRVLQTEVEIKMYMLHKLRNKTSSFPHLKLRKELSDKLTKAWYYTSHEAFTRWKIELTCQCDHKEH